MDAAVANLSLSDEPTRRVITSVEDMMPRDVFYKVIGTSYLTPTELPPVAVCNRSFKDAMYQPRIIMYRAAIAIRKLALTEAHKWYSMAAERFAPCREALIFLGERRRGEDWDPVEAERLNREAIAADSSADETYVLLAPAGYALDVARVNLAKILRKRGAFEEAASLLQAVLAHDPIKAKKKGTLYQPYPSALVLLAEMMVSDETPGLPPGALALLETVPRVTGRRLDGHREYVLCLTHKALAAFHAQGPQGTHARAAFQHANTALSFGYREAVQELGFCLEEGFGTEVNPDQAYPLLLMGVKLNFVRSVTRVREIISDDPPQLRTLRLIQSILTMRAMGQLTDDDMSRNETLAAAWALAQEMPPPAAMVQEIAAGVANANAEDPDHADQFPTREESFAALGIDPPPPTGQDGEA